MLTTPITTNIVTTDSNKAKAFYPEALGLELVTDYGEAAQFNAGGAPLFVYQRPTPPTSDATIASWTVPNIHEVVQELSGKGIEFERYEGFDQDEHGIAARSENGPWAAWFKDPDGNILGLTQMPQP